MPSPARHTLQPNNRSTSSKNSLVEKIVMIVAVAEPLMTLPQVIQIWTTRDVRSLSLTTWVLYTFASLTWFVYGLKIRNKALAVTGVLWTLMEAAVIAGILVLR